MTPAPDPDRPHAVAEAHLAAASAPMARVIEANGPCRLVPRDNVFGVLVTMIIGQQISTAAARTIVGRVERMVAPDDVTPDSLHRYDDEAWRACGLSAPKRRTIRAAVDRCRAEPDFIARYRDMADDAERSRLLCSIHGVGPWTAQMLEIFALLRPDVWPTGDLGLRLAARDQFGLPDVPTAAELLALGEPLRPFRTVATWHLWRSRGFIPQSGLESS